VDTVKVVNLTNVNDKEALKERIEKIATTETPKFTTFQISDYCKEAKLAYVNGCFRSSIFMSALITEQALRHRIVFSSSDWEQNYRKNHRKNFNHIIKIAREKEVDNQAADDANWLRRVRNELSAHPMYVGDSFKHKNKDTFTAKELDQQAWANKLMQNDLLRLLRFIEQKKRTELEERKVSMRNESGEVTEEMPLKDWFKKHMFDLTNFSLWFSLQPMFLEEIAFEAYKKMVSVLHTLALDKSEL
jgi:hypothetical protein